MSNNVIISSDSTTDLSAELKERYNIATLPLGINLGDKTYVDGVDITPDDIYEHHRKTGELPKTSAANLGESLDFSDTGKAALHFISGISGTEGDFAWSNGKSSEILIQLEDAFTTDLFAELNIKNVYNGTQHVIIRSEDIVLYDQVRRKE